LLGFVNINRCFSLLEECVYTFYDNSIFGILHSPVYVVMLFIFF